MAWLGRDGLVEFTHISDSWSIDLLDPSGMAYVYSMCSFILQLVFQSFSSWWSQGKASKKALLKLLFVLHLLMFHCSRIVEWPCFDSRGGEVNSKHSVEETAKYHGYFPPPIYWSLLFVSLPLWIATDLLIYINYLYVIHISSLSFTYNNIFLFGYLTLLM